MHLLVSSWYMSAMFIIIQWVLLTTTPTLISQRTVSLFITLWLRIDRCEDAARKPKAQHVPKRVASTASRNSNPFDASDSNGKTGSYSMETPVYAQPSVKKQPGNSYNNYCRLYRLPMQPIVIYVWVVMRGACIIIVLTDSHACWLAKLPYFLHQWWQHGYNRVYYVRYYIFIMYIL